MALMIGLLALFFGGAAQAQEDLSAGMSPAQLFSMNCAICHKQPQGLAKMSGLEGFLAEHYTSSKQKAAELADYLKSVDRAAGPAHRSRHRDAADRPKHRGKTDAAKKSAKPKSHAKKTAKQKDGKAKSGTSAGAKPKESGKPKAAESKPAKKKHAPRTSEAKREKRKSAAPQKKTD